MDLTRTTGPNATHQARTRLLRAFDGGVRGTPYRVTTPETVLGADATLEGPLHEGKGRSKKGETPRGRVWSWLLLLQAPHSSPSWTGWSARGEEGKRSCRTLACEAGGGTFAAGSSRPVHFGSGLWARIPPPCLSSSCFVCLCSAPGVSPSVGLTSSAAS